MFTPIPDPLTACWTHELPARPAARTTTDALETPDAVRRFLATAAPEGVFVHQHDAIAAFLEGDDVCVATGTASGKSLVFQAAGLDRLARDPHARVLALYPMKALGQEQEERWRRAVAAAGIRADVARIDGSVPTGIRLQHLLKARVIVATPDVLHAWLLPRAGQADHGAIRRFLARLSVVVLDEAHTYTGVFGSNAAFVLRRLQYACALAKCAVPPRFVAASATLKDPSGHLERLTGRSFTIIGPERDASPRHPVSIELVRPADGTDFHSGLAALLASLRDAGERFIAFFDSRKSTEQMAAILQRDEVESAGFEHLAGGSVLPFRAGYEHAHRDLIQSRLTDGSLVGVVSTSALELGLDIPGLSTAVLVGVPTSATSFWQRIGRVGRAGPGRVIVVHAGSIGDDVTFAKPEALLDRPLSESTVYLDNSRVQYIHAMALTREHDLLEGAARPIRRDIVSWPTGFLTLAEDERRGTVPSELRDMKRDAGDIAAISFPLRDVETQFEVWSGRGQIRERLGSLSYGQVMREAYPGAIYYYIGRAFRVTHVDVRGRQVQVAPAARYGTQAGPIVKRIAPQRTIHRMTRHGDLVVADTDLQIRHSVMGFRERRGPTTEAISYPCTAPVSFSQPAFSRTLFTTGLVLAHPALDNPEVAIDVLAAVLLDALLLTVPMERQDVDAASDTLRASWGPVSDGRRVLVLYDQTYGSLHLTARFQDAACLAHALRIVVDTLQARDSLDVGAEAQAVTDATRDAAAALLAAAVDNPPLEEVVTTDSLELGQHLRVMLPRSRGVAAHRPRDVFEIHQIFVRVDLGLCYRGVWMTPEGLRSPGVVPVSELHPGPTEVVWGSYDPETGDQVAA